MTTQIKAGVIAANAITASELASSALSGGSFTGDVTFDTTTLVIDSSNNRVGVGTASPATTLAVNGSTQILGGNALYFQNSAADANGTISGSGGAGENTLSFNSGAMVLNASGNVGIGTSSNISSPLTIQTNQSAGALSIIGRDNGTNDEAVISFYEYDGTTRNSYIIKEAGDLAFATGTGGSPSERLRITSTGDSEFKGNIAFTKQDGMTISGYESLVMQINSQNNQSGRVFQVNNYTTPLFIVNQTGIIDARLPFKFHSTTSDPSITDQGSVYWNSTDKKFRYYTGSGWADLTPPDLTAIGGLDLWADVTNGIMQQTVEDLSGNGRNGTATYATSNIGSIGGNTYIDCGSNYVDYSNSDFVDYNGDVTFFFVMTNRRTYASSGSFITQNYQPATGYHIIRHDGTSDNFQTYTSNGSQNFISTNTPLPVNASINEGVIIIFSIGSSSNWSIYKRENGTEYVDTFSSITASQFKFNSNTNPIRIGTSQWGNEKMDAGFFAWGIIDHEITASERQIIYDYYARKGIAV